MSMPAQGRHGKKEESRAQKKEQAWLETKGRELKRLLRKRLDT
jgi:hypothetical protein